MWQPDEFAGTACGCPQAILNLIIARWPAPLGSSENRFWSLAREPGTGQSTSAGFSRSRAKRRLVFDRFLDSTWSAQTQHQI